MYITKPSTFVIFFSGIYLTRHRFLEMKFQVSQYLQIYTNSVHHEGDALYKNFEFFRSNNLYRIVRSDCLLF